MIDITKELPRPIKNSFLENVLDAIEQEVRADFNEDDEVNRILGRSRLQEREIRIKWWETRDERGNVVVPKFERGEDIQKIGVAPFYLVYFTIKNIRERDKGELREYLDNLFRAGCVTSIASLIVSYWGGIEFVANFLHLSVASGVMALISKVVYNMIQEEKKGEVDLSTLFGIGEEGEEGEVERKEELREVMNEVQDDSEGVIISRKKREYSENLDIKQNVVRTSIGRDEFNNMLIRALDRTSKIRDRYKYSTKREDLVKSMQEYILCNNAAFSEVTNIEKGSLTYNNLCFLIYEGLRAIFTQLTYTGAHTMQVKSLTESQLYYRLEVTLPRIVKADTIVKNISTLESKFKSHENDNDVAINISSYGDSTIFKIMKEVKSPITWGDVIRYYDPVVNDKTYEKFIDEDKYDIPVIAGLQNEETPIIFDLAENTSIAIAGTSGSGKSWGVFSLIFNMIIQSHPGDLSLVIFDFKRDPQYRALARLPHVVGLHFTIEEYNDHLREIVAELNRRKEILDRLGVSKWSELRKSLKDDPVRLRKFPWLFVVFEEMAAVLSSLETAGTKKELVEEFIALSKEIAKQGRSLGMRLVLISQRTTSNELPRDLISECGVKFTFQLTEADLDRVGMLPTGLVPPRRKGSAVFKEEFLKEPVVIRTLGLGGFNDDQIQNLTRMMAFEWHLRIDEEDVEANFPLFEITDNRRVRREEVMKDYYEGRLIAEDLKEKNIDEELEGVEGFSVGKRAGEVSKSRNKEESKVVMKDIRATGKKEVKKEENEVREEEDKSIGGNEIVDLDEEFNIKYEEEQKKEEEYNPDDISPMMGYFNNSDE